MITQSAWDIRITHDEIVALSRAVLHYADDARDKIKGLKLKEQQDLINTLFHLNSFVGKLPTLEDE